MIVSYRMFHVVWSVLWSIMMKTDSKCSDDEGTGRLVESVEEL